MKKDKKKIALTICGFSVLCIGILAAAYFLTRKPDAEFVPAAVETSTQTDSWEEKTAPETESAAESSSPSDKKEGTEADNTQKIISEDETTTTSSLSDTKTKEEAAKEMPSEKPDITEDATNPENHRNMIPTFLSKRRLLLQHRKIKQTALLPPKQTITILTPDRFMILFLAG